MVTMRFPALFHPAPSRRRARCRTCRSVRSGRTRPLSLVAARRGAAHARAVRHPIRCRRRPRRAPGDPAPMPVGHCGGNAGSSEIPPPWDCTSASAIAAVETQVAVDLKRRVRAEQVRVQAPAVLGELRVPGSCLGRSQRAEDEFVHPLAVAEPRPQCGAPRERPACRLGSAQLERSGGRARQLGRPGSA